MLSQATLYICESSRKATAERRPMLRSNSISKTKFCESARLRGVRFTHSPRRPSSCNKSKVFKYARVAELADAHV